jgi:hypothetical protein
LKGTSGVRGAVLLLYDRPPQRLFPDASTIMEHVRAFKRLSRFPVYELNVDEGFPRELTAIDPGAIVLHYSLFGSANYRLSTAFLTWLDRCTGYKVCFFQDEYYYCVTRFSFLSEHEIDCVFTQVEPEYFGEVYGKYTRVPKLVHNLPGHVSDELVCASAHHARLGRVRPIDVGYRGRSLPAYWGRGSQEKAEIGRRFAQLAAGTGLSLDIESSEEARLYGERWYEFIASCRYVLGVEAGVSVFDLEDEVRQEYGKLSAIGRTPTIEELERGALGRWDGRVPLRSISPRHFEAAALQTCQILFEGRYSEVMQPMVHYIPLRKDFSNFDEVLEQIRDSGLRAEIVKNAYQDLIASGDWSYARLIRQVDGVLTEAGLKPRPAPMVAVALAHGARSRELRRQLRWLRRWLLWVRLAPVVRRVAPLTGWIRQRISRLRPAP